MEIRERDDFECAPRCSAHLQRKKDFKFRVSGKSADFPETHFHGKGLEPDKFRRLRQTRIKNKISANYGQSERGGHLKAI